MPADATAACALAGAGEGSGVGVQGREGTGLRVFIRGTVDLLRCVLAGPRCACRAACGCAPWGSGRGRGGWDRLPTAVARAFTGLHRVQLYGYRGAWTSTGMTVASIANAIARGVLALPLGIANRCRAAAVPCHHACCVSFALRTPLMRVWVCAFALRACV